MSLVTPIKRWYWNAITARQMNKLRNQRGVTIGNGSSVHFSATIDSGTDGTIDIGSGVEIDRGVIVAAYGGNIKICDNVYIGPYSVLYGHGGLVVGNKTLIAAHAVIIPANHNWSDPSRPICEQGLTAKGIVIGSDCWVGAGVKILDGVSIGSGCVIGAGAVVTRDLAEYSIAVGVPARVQNLRKIAPSQTEKNGQLA